MDNRTNTIAGWVLGAGIVALGASLVTAEMFHAERPEKMGYPIEGVIGPHDDTVAEVPIAALLATADPGKGADVFKKCSACHTINQGGANGTGPNIWGIMGKPVAAVAGYSYSPALKGKGGTWTWEAMDAWVKSPRTFAEGTKMTFAGLGKPEDRANLLAYLNSQGASPLPLPAAPAAAPANPAEAAAENAAATGPAAAEKGEKEPVLNETQAAKGPGKNIGGDGAPTVSGRAGQTKGH
jgi:cytochrome c